MSHTYFFFADISRPCAALLSTAPLRHVQYLSLLVTVRYVQLYIPFLCCELYAKLHISFLSTVHLKYIQRPCLLEQFPGSHNSAVNSQ
jgi:hypothetical protein